MDPNEARMYVYRHFVAEGRAPSIAEVAVGLGVGTEQVRSAFEALAQGHVLVLQPETREVWMAMPFSAVRTSFSVCVGERRWWAN